MYLHNIPSTQSLLLTLNLLTFGLVEKHGVVMFYPWLFFPSDNVWCSQRADAPRCAHFSTVIKPSWITQQILVEKCAHRGASACRERQSMFKIVTWTKHKTWTKHHNSEKHYLCYFSGEIVKRVVRMVCAGGKS